VKIVITGGTGFVGRNTARAFLEAGHEVVLTARGHDRTDPGIRQTARSRFIGVGLDDVESLAEAFAGANVVVHCAGINRETGAQTYQRVHVEGTRRVVEAARRAGVAKIIFVSFLRARPNCRSAYHESKWAAEEIVRGSGLDYAVLKCGVIYGKGDHMLDHLSRCFYTFPIFAFVGFQDKPIRPNAVEDVARIIKASSVNGALSRRTVAVRGPEELTLRQAVRRVARVVGRKPLMFPMPLWCHYILGWCVERLMVVPMVSTAQVRMLSEGLAEPAPPCDILPPELAPRLRFDEERIRAGLPAPGPFTWRELFWGGPKEKRSHFDNVFFTMP
jgi:nucleoside-diphosphate-sugar epimerase